MARRRLAAMETAPSSNWFRTGDGTWKEKILDEFANFSEGSAPQSALIFDQAGNLYGTTDGDYRRAGTVVELVPNLDGSWEEKTLYEFRGGYDGGSPYGSLVFDQAGNLYGTASHGGLHGGGTVFKLAPNSDGSWKLTTLYDFCLRNNCDDGEIPIAGVTFDQAGNLYGTTYYGGFGRGTVFTLAPQADGSWKENVLYRFCYRPNCNDGAQPYAGLIFDAAGNLYITTPFGGAHNQGTVFKLARNRDGSWSEHVLHSFCSATNCNNGAQPVAGLVFDAAGNLYGTAQVGGGPGCYGNLGCGVVFKLVPNSNGRWRVNVLHRRLMVGHW